VALNELGEVADPEEVNSIMAQADRNGDGTIDYEEFCIMWVLLDRSVCLKPKR